MSLEGLSQSERLSKLGILPHECAISCGMSAMGTTVVEFVSSISPDRPEGSPDVTQINPDGTEVQEISPDGQRFGFHCKAVDKDGNHCSEVCRVGKIGTQDKLFIKVPKEGALLGICKPVKKPEDKEDAKNITLYRRLN